MFVFPEDAELPDESAYRIQGVRQVGFDLSQVLNNPESRLGARGPEADPVVRALIEGYAAKQDEEQMKSKDPERTITVDASTLVNDLGPIAAQEIERLFLAHEIELPTEDGLLMDQACIKLALAYVTSAEDKDDGMFSRPGACE